MADRPANREGLVTRLMLFARSLVLFGVVAVGLPWALVLAARERFGGGAPFHGVASPADWSLTRIRTVLTEQLTEQTVADIVIRLALVVAWAGVIVIVVTVVAEVVHMVRHDGLAMPDIRGLGLTQRTARVIASGLLVVVPLLTSPTSTVADGASTRGPGRRIGSVMYVEPGAASPSASTVHVDASPGGPRAVRSTPTGPMSRGASAAVGPESTTGSGEYVVQPGDSIYGIAERLVGPDSGRVAAFAERLVDTNLGRRMPDGRCFDNAAFIDVGWVLELPDGMVLPSSPKGTTAAVHVVQPGESLWSIAEDELGDPERWPEVYGANEGRRFQDGRRLDDPDLIQPGWELQLPVVAEAEERSSRSPGPIAAPEPDETISLAEIATPASVPDPAVADRIAGSVEADDPVNADIGSAGVAEATAPVSPEGPTPARPDNVWDEVGIHPNEVVPAGSNPETVTDVEAESRVPPLLPMGAAAMLSAGVLTLLGVRRRRQLRRARPRASLPPPAARSATTERVLRSIDVGERFARVDIAIRAVAMSLVDRGERVRALFVGPDGGVELHLTGPAELPTPWDGGGAIWHLAASTPLELLADEARSVGRPCPVLAQLGTDHAGRDVYVDLEAMEAIEVGGPGEQADAVVAAIAATLAGSLLAEVATLVGLGVADEAFLGHRRYIAVSGASQAFDVASAAIGSTGAARSSTFELRATGTATETWEPAVVLIGAAAGAVVVPSERTGLAVVSASPIQGPSSRLAPDGDAWALQPAGIRLTPVGLTPDDIEAIAELVAVVDAEPDAEPAERPPAMPVPPPSLDRSALADHTILPGRADLHDLDDLDDLDERPTSAHTTVDGDAASERLDVAGAIDDMTDDVVIDDGVRASVARPPLPPPAPLPAPAPASPPPHRLLVRTIGPVGVIDRDGAEVSFERSKTRELVAWLVTHRERSTRSAARTALWELDVRDATFANVVSEARRSLARLVEPPEGEEWVGRTMTDALPLHELVLSDADVLRHALDAARLQPPAEAVVTLTPAVDLISGVPFEGTSYLWPDSEGITSHLVLLAVTATTELAAHCLSIGDVEGVFHATARGLQVLPAHEELIGLRMEAHARAGDHAGIRQEWESYERVVNGDPWSDGEPSPKLVDLRRRLMNPSR